MIARPPTTVAIVGYGAIGRYTVDAMAGDAHCRVGAVIVRTARVAEVQAALGPSIQVCDSIASLAEPPDLIVEAAGHGALGEHGVPALRAGFRLLVVSVGALADRALLEVLEEAATEGGGVAEIAPGAVGGIDALAAARQGGLERVTYTSRKPPAAWKGTPGEALCDLDRLDAPFTPLRRPGRRSRADLSEERERGGDRGLGRQPASTAPRCASSPTRRRPETCTRSRPWVRSAGWRCAWRAGRCRTIPRPPASPPSPSCARSATMPRRSGFDRASNTCGAKHFKCSKI